MVDISHRPHRLQPLVGVVVAVEDHVHPAGDQQRPQVHELPLARVGSRPTPTVAGSDMAASRVISAR
jgi:hypothetical protein